MNRYVMRDVPPVTLAYIAGLVDGEGTITIRRRFRAKGAGYDEYHAWLAVAQKDPTVLYWIRDTFGIGSVVKQNLREGDSAGRIVKARTMHQWTVGLHAAVEIIKSLYPYLRIKVRQAELVMEFHAFKASWDARRRQGGYKGTLPTPPEMIERYREMCVAVQTLNGRKVIFTGPRFQKN